MALHQNAISISSLLQYPPISSGLSEISKIETSGVERREKWRSSTADFLQWISCSNKMHFPLTEEINVLLFTSPSPQDALWRLLSRPLINRILHRTAQSKRLHKSHERRSQVISTSWDSCVKVSVWEAAAGLSVNRRPSDTRAYYASPLQPYQ